MKGVHQASFLMSLFHCSKHVFNVLQLEERLQTTLQSQEAKLSRDYETLMNNFYRELEKLKRTQQQNRERSVRLRLRGSVYSDINISFKTFFLSLCLMAYLFPFLRTSETFPVNFEIFAL